MLFNSLEFCVFFVFVSTAFFVLPPRHRWMLLLVASYYFYMAWRPLYAILILFSTSVDYVAALAIPRTSSQAGRRGWLLSSLAANLGLEGERNLVGN